MSLIEPRNRQKRLLIVGDTPQFGQTIALILGGEQNLKWSVRYTTYEGFRGMVSPRLFRDTDLFVLDLWRSYPTGLRAEGIAVAEQLARQNARSLIVSPLSIGARTDISGYWDMAASVSLPQSCDLLLKEKGRRSPAPPEMLKNLLDRFLAAPSGHDENPRATRDPGR